jgi:hypothetical protein
MLHNLMLAYIVAGFATFAVSLISVQIWLTKP